MNPKVNMISKTNSAVGHIRTAIIQLEIAKAEAQSLKQWGTMAYLHDQIQRLEEIMISDGGECGLEVCANKLNQSR